MFSTDTPIAQDITRLIVRIREKHPTGIDRVDYAYAKQIFNGASNRYGIVTTPYGPLVLLHDAVEDILRRIETQWSDHLPLCYDPVFMRLKETLEQEHPAGTVWRRYTFPKKRPSVLRKVKWVIEKLLPFRVNLPGYLPHIATLAPYWKQMRKSSVLPKGCYYVHLSHAQLHHPKLFQWLEQRPDVRALFFLHDLIPITHPEYACSDHEPILHERRLRTVAERGWHIMVNTHAVKRELESFYQKEGIKHAPITAHWLGIDPVFFGRYERIQAQRPYYVLCSTIDVRKNHLMILHVWREMALELKERTPLLLVIGNQGINVEMVSNFLKKCRIIRPHLLTVHDMTSQGLASILSSASGAMMPSFAEGFGLPIVEARAQGTATFISSIPAHMEFSDAASISLDPLDAQGWKDALMAHYNRVVSGTHHPHSDQGALIQKQFSWERHFESLEEALRSRKQFQEPKACVEHAAVVV